MPFVGENDSVVGVFHAEKEKHTGLFCEKADGARRSVRCRCHPAAGVKCIFQQVAEHGAQLHICEWQKSRKQQLKAYLNM